MEKANVTSTQLGKRLEALERRLQILSDDVAHLQRHAAELDDLRNEVGKLKLEVEEFRDE